MKNNLMFIRVKVKKERIKDLMLFKAYFDKLSDSKNNLLISEPLTLINYDVNKTHRKFLLIVPLILNFPFFFFPLTVFPKTIYFISFLIKSRFRLGFRPMLPFNASEVLYNDR